MKKQCALKTVKFHYNQQLRSQITPLHSVAETIVKMIQTQLRQCKRRSDYDLSLSSTDLCGSAMNNIVRSPVYVQSYPPNMHCVYNISVTHGKLQKLVFQIFDLAIDPECRLEPIFH